MTAPRYAMLTEGAARKMKSEVLENIIEQAIGIDLHPAEYRNRNRCRYDQNKYAALFVMSLSRRMGCKPVGDGGVVHRPAREYRPYRRHP